MYEVLAVAALVAVCVVYAAALRMFMAHQAPYIQVHHPVAPSVAIRVATSMTGS